MKTRRRQSSSERDGAPASSRPADGLPARRLSSQPNTRRAGCPASGGLEARTPSTLALLLLVLALACTSGPVPPADLDTANEACRWCRMGVSNRSFAAQIVASGEEPRFFDDIGCMANYVRNRKPSGDYSVYVADHQSKRWMAAKSAHYFRCDALETPMGSHLIASAAGAVPSGCVATTLQGVFR